MIYSLGLQILNKSNFISLNEQLSRQIIFQQFFHSHSSKYIKCNYESNLNKLNNKSYLKINLKIFNHLKLSQCNDPINCQFRFHKHIGFSSASVAHYYSSPIRQLLNANKLYNFSTSKSLANFAIDLSPSTQTISHIRSPFNLVNRAEYINIPNLPDRHLLSRSFAINNQSNQNRNPNDKRENQSAQIHSENQKSDNQAAVTISSSSLSTSSSANITKPKSTTVSLPTSRWARIKVSIIKELRHYWFGTKLLVYETRIAWGLLVSKVFKGIELSRRERKQLTRTIADLLRVVPFAVIVAIPFAELALPVLLKIFPKMLPSTYLDSVGEEAKMQKELQAKIEMARFLQETTAQMAEQLTQMKEESERKLRSDHDKRIPSIDLWIC